MQATQDAARAALSSPRSTAGLRLDEMPARRGVVPSLNGLRALSILVVFLSHTVSDRLFPGGFGVRVFFLISGFLITRLMFVEWRRTGRVALRDFYIRRFLRLYPVVLVFTVGVVAVFLALRPADIRWAEPLSALFYFANYYYSVLSQTGHTGGTMPFAIFWSLSVEEHFYIVFPLLFVALRADPRRLAVACGIVLVGCLALRLAVASADPALLDSFTFYYQTQYQFDSIGFGVLVAALCEFEGGRAALRRLFSPVAIGVALLLLIAGFAIRDTFFRETIRYSMLSAAVLVGVVNVLFSERLGPVQRLLNTRPLDWIGRLSYSIYVWHFAARTMIEPGLGLAGDVAVWVVATLVLSTASYYLLEQPLAALRHSFGSVAPERALNPER